MEVLDLFEQQSSSKAKGFTHDNVKALERMQHKGKLWRLS